MHVKDPVWNYRKSRGDIPGHTVPHTKTMWAAMAEWYVLWTRYPQFVGSSPTTATRHFCNVLGQDIHLKLLRPTQS